MKITRYIKNQGNLNLNEKRQSTDVNPDMTKMLELSDKDFKVATITMLQGCYRNAVLNTFEINEKQKISTKK